MKIKKFWPEEASLMPLDPPMALSKYLGLIQ